MASGATSLGLVREELFATIGEAEQGLEHFIVDRTNGSLLQQAVEALHQVRGTLNLIELTGAELLAQEILRVATDIPVAAGEERDGQLAALGNALYVLRQYLESVDVSRQEMPELLLPAINTLRTVGGQPPLPESFFFSVRLDQPRPPQAAVPADPRRRDADLRRLRQAYQVGLLGFLRGNDAAASLALMRRALSRLDALLAGQPAARLCWIGAAALEALEQGELLPRLARKQLLGRLDREIRLFGQPGYEPPKALLKELLYLVALAESSGPLATQVREHYALNPLPFSDQLLEEESVRLAGPGQSVMRSLTSAIQEELAAIKDLLDLVERGVAPQDAFPNLHQQIGRLSKTLNMVGMTWAGNMLSAQLGFVSAWAAGQPPTHLELQRLADSLLSLEGTLPTLVNLETRAAQAQRERESEDTAFARHQLNEARIVVIDEARAGLALAKRAITAYIESSGDKLHLANVPFTLQAVRGGIWFLGQVRTAELIGACAAFIQQQMVEGAEMPAQARLETLADALASLEYFLEGSALGVVDDSRRHVLDMAADSLRMLGQPVAVA